MSRQDTLWLASLQLWASGIARRLHLPEVAIADLVLQAFAHAAAQWTAFRPPADLPARTARRRWLAGLVFHFARTFQGSQEAGPDSDRFSQSHAPEPLLPHSPEKLTATEELVRYLETVLSAERRRVWLAYEIDALSLTEIARQEGCSLARIEAVLERARMDLDIALTSSL